MKKRYVKPMLAYETFVLSQSIAACYYKLNADVNACTTDPDPDTGFTFFTVAANCFMNESNGLNYCYNNGTDGFNAFMS